MYIVPYSMTKAQNNTSWFMSACTKCTSVLMMCCWCCTAQDNTAVHLCVIKWLRREVLCIPVNIQSRATGIGDVQWDWIGRISPVWCPEAYTQWTNTGQCQSFSQQTDNGGICVNYTWCIGNNAEWQKTQGGRQSPGGNRLCTRDAGNAIRVMIIHCAHRVWMGISYWI